MDESIHHETKKEPEPALPMSVWDEADDFPLCDWQTEVANDDTRLGYWDWVRAQRENQEDDNG